MERFERKGCHSDAGARSARLARILKHGARLREWGQQRPKFKDKMFDVRDDEFVTDWVRGS